MADTVLSAFVSVCVYLLLLLEIIAKYILTIRELALMFHALFWFVNRFKTIHVSGPQIFNHY